MTDKKRIQVNQNNININLNKIRKLESNYLRPRVIQKPIPQPKAPVIDYSRLESLEKKNRELLASNRKNKDTINKLQNRISELEKLQNRIEKLEKSQNKPRELNLEQNTKVSSEELLELEEKFLDKLNSKFRIVNSKMEKFKSEVMPSIDQVLTHRALKSQRKKRSGR